MRSMFETLCKGEPLLALSTARPKRQSSATTVARASGADPSRTKRSRTGQRRWQRRNGACISDYNNYEWLPYIQWQDDAHNNITFNKKHIMCLIFVAPRKPRDGTLRWSGGKNDIFQIVHMTKVSTQIHSSISQYDVYKVSSKKMTIT